MSRRTFLPTPASSTDIIGKADVLVTQLDPSFALPPAAITASNGSASPSSVASHGSDSSYRPVSPPSSAGTRKASTKESSVSPRKRARITQQPVSAEACDLPPPPTRSRQFKPMKPRDHEADRADSIAGAGEPSNSTPAPKAGGSKRKKADGTTAAGRKIARKTAHSLIERRRRSKMNEEFGVLKDMIPACRGQDMHKLSILQASIDYMRYLEKCVSDLKASHQARHPPSLPPDYTVSDPYPPFDHRKGDGDEYEQEDEEEDGSEDEEMVEETSPTSALSNNRKTIGASASSFVPATHTSSSSPGAHHSPYGPTPSNTSPIFEALDRRRLSYALSYTSSGHFAQSSPAFSVQSSHASTSFTSLTSPALRPQPDQDDHEASSALLMLNSDRRSWTSANGGRGMSVRDLLSH
ncbi:hypothetical protein H2199_001695 [Coniosporium tulheliwenetii]|uniref:Uncharacterized protein n=1 Tax=Coniosporium tulheliwenetii TaxID=3383036 RepID=A0ACC2ZKD2_9PEZI|nr:hypothetical protein H2199_001695 [Cladosporium sp. JES 115]